MELILERSYHPEGTNGELWYKGLLIGYTIELPWRNNQRNLSCIPEGRYKLVMRYTEERGWHIHIPDVPGRTWILFHAANDALKELRGCIAPVAQLIGPGRGIESRFATKQLEGLIQTAYQHKEDVFITIKLKEIMNLLQRATAPTPKIFRILRTIGLALAAAGGAILASPVALPAGVAAIGGYLALGGGVLTAVSQVTVDESAKSKDAQKNDG